LPGASATQTEKPPAWFADLRPSAILSRAWTDNGGFLVLTAAVVLAGFGLQYVFELPGLMRDLFYTESFRYLVLFLFLPLPFGLLIGRLRVKDRKGRFLPGREGWRIALRQFADRYLHPGSLLRALFAGVGITLILNTYASWKRVIPTVRPFSWDERFAVLDRVVHGGNDPWALIHPWLTRWGATPWLDTVYYTWLPAIFAGIGFLVWTRHRDLRLRGLVGIVFVWIGLGAIAATAFSSAGPCFYPHLVTGANPFANLMSSLQSTAAETGMIAPGLQQTMWQLNGKADADLYIAGISAMPSVHVAMPALFGMLTWQRSRLLGLACWVYTALILVATVHLGWHYAIDGYASIVAVALYWELSAHVVHRDLAEGRK
jgi:hypothetical protein